MFYCRKKITEDLHGLTYLMEVLDNILPITIDDASKNNSSNIQVPMFCFGYTK